MPVIMIDVDQNTWEGMQRKNQVEEILSQLVADYKQRIEEMGEKIPASTCVVLRVDGRKVRQLQPFLLN